MIQRLGFASDDVTNWLADDEDGDYVLYSDHLKELKEAIEEIEADILVTERSFNNAGTQVKPLIRQEIMGLQRALDVLRSRITEEGGGK